MGAKELGLFLRTVRLAADLSRDQLASKAGISSSHIQRIELGQRDITAMRLAQIADVLRLDPQRVFSLLLSGSMPDEEVQALAYQDIAATLSIKPDSELQKIRDAARRFLDETTEEQ
jgi:transcriptional regulator with XRE-family HTH domain